MEDETNLSLLKNTLRLPLGALAKANASTDTSTSGPTPDASSSVGLHDHHNIEIKTVSELTAGPSMVETEIYLFVPRSFELKSVSKDDLIRDLRSRVRLALSLHDERGTTAFDEALKSLKNVLVSLQQSITESDTNQEINNVLFEPALEAAKDLSIVVSETLKHRGSDHARKLLISHSLMTITKVATAGLEQLSIDLSETARMMDQFRTELTEANLLSESQSNPSIASLLDEYLSHLYVQYLGSIRGELDRCATPKGAEDDLNYVRARGTVEKTLVCLQEDEALRRLQFGVRSADEETELEREKRVVRLSHLKKFFQSKTFIDVTRQQSAKKISESTATIGTAAAAAVAAAIETYGRGAVTHFAWQGVAVVSVGVIFYVLRDRLKDHMKKVFHQKALQFLPDFEQKLIADTKTIGRVKEWFGHRKKNELPKDVIDLRHAACATEMEQRLPEDVFLCKRIQEVAAAHLAHGDSKAPHSRLLYENTRLNFERYLKHMDDAFKEFMDLDSNGRLTSARSHRVYHFYVVVKTTSRAMELKNKKESASPAKARSLVYRIVLDKTGLVRIENATPEK